MMDPPDHTILRAPLQKTFSPRAAMALKDGIDGIHERFAACVQPEVNARAWEVASGIMVCPLRTPTLPPATHTNCYLVGRDALIVIDPASPYADEQEALDGFVDELAANGRRVRAIWLTHHHQDHVSGAQHLSKRLGVPIFAHPETIRLLGWPDMRRLSDGETLDLGALRLRAVFTPGHAPGHFCFVEERTKFMITGDMVAGIGTIVIDPDEGDMAHYLASLERMKSLSPFALLPAHGPTIANPVAKLDEYRRHRLWREERVFASLAKRGTSSAAELVPDVYDDLDPKIFALAERSLLAHLKKLIQDERVVERAGRFSPRDAV